MCDTAFRELDSAVTKYAGPNETAAFHSLMQRVTVVADNPSARAQALLTTRSVGANDRTIFGTADQMGIPIFINDARFLRAAAAQGVWFDAYVHPSVSMRGW